jgi:hypothetical protein
MAAFRFDLPGGAPSRFWFMRGGIPCCGIQRCVRSHQGIHRCFLLRPGLNRLNGKPKKELLAASEPALSDRRGVEWACAQPGSPTRVFCVAGWAAGVPDTRFLRGGVGAGVPDTRFLRGGWKRSGVSIRSHRDSSSNPTFRKDRERWATLCVGTDRNKAILSGVREGWATRRVDCVDFIRPGSERSFFLLLVGPLL